MAAYRLLDYDNDNAELVASVSYDYEIRGGERIIHSGTSYRVRNIEHDPANAKTNLHVTQSNS